jgi:ubiquitin carboxyl-terminal hydrolase 4/11/15
LPGLWTGTAQPDNTASTQHPKKRKLNGDKTHTSTSVGCASDAGLSDSDPSPRSSPSRARQHSSTSPEPPPRFIPPHVYSEVREASASHDPESPAREISLTAASSPSDAYAGLTLDSEGGAADVVGMSGQRRDSLTLRDDAAPDSVDTPVETPETPEKSNHSNNTHEAAPARRQSRSTSPAKRRASEMDDENASDGERMEVDVPASPNRLKPAESERPGTLGASRDVRGASVDMLAQQPYLTSANSSPKSSHSNTSTDSTLNTSTSAASAEKRKETGSADKEMEMETDDAAVTVPALSDQVRIISEKVMTPPEDGQVGYLVSTQWLARVMSRCDEGQQYGPFDKTATDGEIGPVDNTPLLPSGEHHYCDDLSFSAHQLDLATLDLTLKDDHDELFIPLGPEIRFEHDYVIMPQVAYDMIVQWYGLIPAHPVIKRYAHATNPDAEDKNVQWELNPPIFTIRKLRSDSGGALSKHLLQEASSKAPRVVSSANSLYKSFLVRVKAAAGVQKPTKVRVWRVLKTDRAAPATTTKTTVMTSMLSPPASRESSPQSRSSLPPLSPLPPLLIDSTSFNDLGDGTDRELLHANDESNNSKYNGSLQLGTLGLAADQILILDEQTSLSGDIFTSDIVKKSANKNGLSLTGVKKAGLLSQNSSGRSSPTGGIMTRGRAQGRSKGTVGLTNLGNTCYMNSALQCIRATEELSAFFLEKRWKDELNGDNPLGHNGQIAKTYAGFLESVYQPGQTSFAPRNFKSVLSRCGPQFSGYGQQDSQEFMSFLVDALHEDLNRVHKKPYTENPDSDDKTVNDPEAVKALGEIFRKNFRARNDSVVMDLFNGFYKNTMVCPICDKVSITFDPYSLLTLQLPIEHSWQGVITFFPLHGKPVKVEIDMDKHATIRTMKEFVASRIPGTTAKRMMMAEVFGHKFFRTVEDKQTIMEVNISGRDDMLIYELDDEPTNFPAPKRKSKKVRSMLTIGGYDTEEDDMPEADSPMSERMMVPIFHRAQINNYGASKSLVLTPSFITLTRDEAQDFDEVYRKILGQAAILTTKDIFADADADDESSIEQDTIITTEEDASSTAEPSVQARSVESEDGIIDITMTGSEQTESDTPRLNFLRPKPPGMETGGSIPRQLRNLFELKYIPAGNEMIQTGWSNFEQSRNYPALSSRIPVPPRRMSTESSTSQSPTASSETSDVDEVLPSAQPSFSNDVESEPENEMFSVKPGSSSRNSKANKKTKNKNRNKPTRSYGKKNKQQRSLHSSLANRRTSESSETAREVKTDGIPALVRLGEAIVVDWNAEAYFDYFGGSTEQGDEAKKVAEVLPDEDLAEKKRKRSIRKKHGVTLDECFAETAKGEILTEENAWYCNRCKELRMASKQLEIWTAPDILVVHLKRFSAQRQFRDKIDVLVDFPTEGLDLTGKVGLIEGKDMTYDLFAVDNHYGGLGGGHYTAFAKNFIDGKWYEYNGKPPQSVRFSLNSDAKISTQTHPFPNANQSVLSPARHIYFSTAVVQRPL